MMNYKLSKSSPNKKKTILKFNAKSFVRLITVQTNIYTEPTKKIDNIHKSTDEVSAISL